MWTLRRASVPLRNYGVGTKISKNHFTITNAQDHGIGILESPQLISENKCLSLKRFKCTQSVCKNVSLLKRGFCKNVSLLKRGFSLQTRAKDTDEGFSELGVSDSTKSDNENDDESISEPEFSGEDDYDVVESETSQYTRRDTTELFKAIMGSQSRSVHDTLDKWVSEGKKLTRDEIKLTLRNFRNFRMNKKALELLETLEASNQFDFDEKNYASSVDLIAKVQGLKRAEKYIESIPDSFRGEIIYRTLLANCVRVNNMKKTEEVFKKMRDLGFSMTPFSYEQLLILYKRHDRKKFANTLQLMEKENVKPSLVAYKLLIANEGDMARIEQILEKMKAGGIEPDTHVRFILARRFASCGLKDKVEAVLKEMEGSNLKENRKACRSLILLYAELGQGDQVERVWKACETDPHFLECMAAIEAWGKLKKVEEAEAVFNTMLKIWKQPSSKQYTALLKVYANNKMLDKGQDLVKRMLDSGCRVGPLAWNALVKLYVEAGEVEKADSALTKFTQQSHMKPLPCTYKALLDQYARRGDVHNSEKIVYRMRRDGHSVQFLHFQYLLQAYVNAKKPAYGIRERMKADNIFPNKTLSELVHQVDPFRETAASYLL